MAADGEHVDGTTLTRRIRVRAAHRGAVTRLINQLGEVLPSADVNKLKQVRQSLLTKMELLSRMDDEILTMVEEDQVEDEVELADLVREKAELAIVSIDEALVALPKKSKPKKKYKKRSSCSQESSQSSPSSSSSGDEGDLFPPCLFQAGSTNKPETNASTCSSGITKKSLTTQGSNLSSSAAPFLPTAWILPFPSVSPLKEALPSTTPPSMSGHLPMSNQGPPLHKDHGEPVSSVCTTYSTNVYDSIIATSAPHLRTPQPSNSFSAYVADNYVPFSPMPASNVPSRVTLPTIPEIIVPIEPPPLLPLTLHDEVELSPHTDSRVTRSHVPTDDAAVTVRQPHRIVSALATALPFSPMYLLKIQAMEQITCR